MEASPSKGRLGLAVLVSSPEIDLLCRVSMQIAFLLVRVSRCEYANRVLAGSCISFVRCPRISRRRPSQFLSFIPWVSSTVTLTRQTLS